MGWKGTMRSVGTAIRKAERAEAKRQRELAKQYKQIEKMEALERAEYEVEVYENYVERLVSVHKEVSPPIDWESLIISDEQKPTKSRKNEEKAKETLNSFQPLFFDKIFGRIEKKKKKLEERVEHAQKEDEKEFQELLTMFSEAKKENEIAKKILNDENGAFTEAISHFSQSAEFIEISELGSSVTFEIEDNKFVSAKIYVHAEDVIPDEAKTLLKSGKLSEKKIPTGKRNELRQDYVCSCVIRVANEIFSILPADITVVTAMDELLNSSTGHKEEVPILSVAISRKTLRGLNLDTIDPSDSIRNFVHNMSFKKTLGFSKVEELDAEQFMKEGKTKSA